MSQQQPKSIRQVEMFTQFGQRLGVQRRHIDRLLDFAGGEEVDEQLDRFDRDVDLSFFGAGAKVWSAEDAGQAEQGAVGARLFGVNVQSDARDVPSLIASAKAASS